MIELRYYLRYKSECQHCDPSKETEIVHPETGQVVATAINEVLGQAICDLMNEKADY